MTETQEIPAEIMAEAQEIARAARKLVRNSVDAIAVEEMLRDRILAALMASDTAARKECAEIARGCTRTVPIDDDGINCTILPATGHEIATAIEATITGGRND
jgi:electron transfer flavoprotein alpha/beta subunit